MKILFIPSIWTNNKEKSTYYAPPPPPKKLFAFIFVSNQNYLKLKTNIVWFKIFIHFCNFYFYFFTNNYEKKNW